MAKTKISQYSATAADNTDISNINIAEGCSPANVNNAIRTLMAQLKDQQDGTSGDPFTVAGTLVASGTIDITGGFKLDGSAGTSGQLLASTGSATPVWVNAFPSGGIIMWSGTIAAIPSGWYLCNGSNGTPDLRNRFVIGAYSDDSGVAKTTITGSSTQTGGSKDAVLVSHTHTATSTVTDPSHNHVVWGDAGGGSGGFDGSGDRNQTTDNSYTGITVATSISTEGVSETNANLVPYFALAFIMKA